MATASFGEGVPVEEALGALFRNAPTLTPISARILLRDRYETLYGIYNHDRIEPDRPMALVGMHWAEDSSAGSLLYERIADFESKEIYRRFGLSLTEFLDLPRDVVIKIMEIATKRLTENTNTVNQILQATENGKL